VSGERTSRGCDEGWDRGAIVDEQAAIVWRGCRALGIAGGLAGENARDDLGCCGNRRDGSAYKKRALSHVGDGRGGRRVGKKRIEKEKDLLQTLGVDIHCGTYGGGPDAQGGCSL
jgi:hypothetical protein